MGDCRISGLEEIYLQHWGYKADGVFVEIGAYDGSSWSNTCGLADIGWTGLYIEPVEASFKRCQERHAGNLVQVLNYAVGNSAGEVEIHLGGPFSTISEKALANYKRLGWWKGEGELAMVQMITLDELLATYDIAPEFDLLVIDVEGYEWEVIRGFKIDHWRPQMVIIELHDASPKYECIRDECLRIVDFFARHAYSPVYKDLGNTVYVKC